MELMTKNIATICAVGEKYVKDVTSYIHRFDTNKWDIHILTDNINAFPQYTTYEYTNSIFSYFDKLVFSIKILKKYKKGVLSLDADKLNILSEEFLNYNHNYPEFRYYSINRWAPYFDHIKENGHWSLIYDYFRYLDMNVNEIRNFWEEVFYFPYEIFKNRQINVDIETLKPLFETRSILDHWSRPCLGEGEGIAIGFLLNKYNFKIKEFDCEVFPNNNPFGKEEKLI